jgi:hypothetical protein
LPTNLHGDGRSTLLVEIGNDDLCSPLGKCFHYSASDTAGAARNKSHFVFQRQLFHLCCFTIGATLRASLMTYFPPITAGGGNQLCTFRDLSINITKAYGHFRQPGSLRDPSGSSI